MAATSSGPKFCSFCGKSFEQPPAKYCSLCGSLNEEAQRNATNTSRETQLNFGMHSSVSETKFRPRPRLESLTGGQQTSLSLTAFRSRKEENRGSLFRPSKVKKTTEKDVTIRIGIFKFDPEKLKLKPQWGKTLPLTVSRNSTYAMILDKAIAKRKAHDRHFNNSIIVQAEEYQLVYPDGSDAIFLPGKAGTFFDLQSYKADLGVPYAKVTLYLCSRKDLEICKQEEIKADEDDDKPDDFGDILGNNDDDFDVEMSNWGDEMCNVSEVSVSTLTPVPTPVSVVQSRQSAAPIASPQEVFLKCPTCQIHFPERDIAQHADMCAETAHIETFSKLFAEIPQEILQDPPSEDEDASGVAENIVLCPVPDQMAILKSLEHNLKSQARINVRRGRFFVDYVEARKRCSWILPENKLKVVFIGEPAVDTGGPRREFLTEVLKEVDRRLFENGVPIINTSAIADHEFELSGNLMVASLLQGGQSPCLLKEWVYGITVSGLADKQIPVEEISSEVMKNLYKKLSGCETKQEVQDILEEDSNYDILQQIGFRGAIHKITLETRDKIMRSILIKDVVQDRLPMINQLADGLKSCGMLDVIKQYPEAMKSLFCKTEERLMEEDTFLGLFITDFSNEQRKKFAEQDTYKAFCDFVGALCHEGVHGMNICQLLQFITGVSTVPALGFEEKLRLSFTHGCKENCRCFPTASTCDLLLRIPIHLRTYDDMSESFQTALKDGFAFGVI